MIRAPLSQLPKEIVVARMGRWGAAPDVARCYDEFKTPGLVDLVVAVRPSGEVDEVQVWGKFAHTAMGDCVVRAVAKVRFPPFEGALARFSYPYMLR
jgi:hypothetical protein